MVESEFSKLVTRVRFPSPAPKVPMKNKIASFLHRFGVSPNQLTFLGLALAALSGWLIFQNYLFWASAALLASGLVDMLDGAVARVSGKQSIFGGILDSTLDRYGDGFVFAGLLFHFGEAGRYDLAGLALSAWLGAFAVSYVRARGECERVSCRVGFWERGERIGVLVLALAVDNVGTAAWLLGLATHWTVFQRLRAAATRAVPAKSPSRNDRAYFIKIALLAVALIFVRIP